MPEFALILLYLFNLIIIILLIILLSRNSNKQFSQFEAHFSNLEKNQERNERIAREEIIKNREEYHLNAKQQREEMGNALKNFSDSLFSRISEIANLQKNQLDIFTNQLAQLTQTNEQKLDKMRQTIEERLRLLQDDNTKKLEQMRAVVDEKLQNTLEKRLGESFKLVSERLELVHKGLGEMQTLAIGVGDLKKVLTNVKTRGIWGEIQLENLLEQILTPEQYEKNVNTKNGSNERVEFAIKLPARDGKDGITWIPLDAKFPLEDYQKLIEAQEQVNLNLIEEIGKSLENKIKFEAKNIKEKYLDPPNTTDFGILFLPIEGLYAEILRRSGLWELIQREYKVIITGPTTLSAILNSLQMGFRTLAIEKRSSEIWRVLGAVKTEFDNFVDILSNAQKKINQAGEEIDKLVGVRTRQIQKKLKDVQKLPALEVTNLIEIEELEN
ncbi:MAG: DNA recombination protein RmuC [Armatimonadetes bacterium]|nr:DNA recombination protein RmuC [Armatimonadota bacterium]